MTWFKKIFEIYNTWDNKISYDLENLWIKRPHSWDTCYSVYEKFVKEYNNRKNWNYLPVWVIALGFTKNITTILPNVKKLNSLIANCNFGSSWIWLVSIEEYLNTLYLWDWEYIKEVTEKFNINKKIRVFLVSSVRIWIFERNKISYQNSLVLRYLEPLYNIVKDNKMHEEMW